MPEEPLWIRIFGHLTCSDSGELMLSRELKDLTASHDARVIVVGTDADAGDYVYMTIKAVDASTNQVMSAHSWLVPAGEKGAVRNLLKKG